jgi:hypothetical protein
MRIILLISSRGRRRIFDADSWRAGEGGQGRTETSTSVEASLRDRHHNESLLHCSQRRRVKAFFWVDRLELLACLSVRASERDREETQMLATGSKRTCTSRWRTYRGIVQSTYDIVVLS